MKYTVKMSCGHEETVELFGKTSERERKIEYFQNQGLCKDCYKKKMVEKQKKEGLIFNAYVLPEIDEHDGQLLLMLYFTGNTLTYKDKIKQLGYKWGMDSELDRLVWSKEVKCEDFKTERDAAENIGAVKFDSDRILNESDYLADALNLLLRWEDRKKTVSDKGIVKPEIPDILKGAKWNGVIYGREDHYSIYSSGEKINLSNDEAEEIREYLQKKDEYREIMSQIEESVKNTHINYENPEIVRYIENVCKQMDIDLKKVIV